MKKRLSIIIVTYNSQAVIVDCLQSIQKFNDIGDELEIIIVDNSPKFEIKNLIKSLNLDLDIKAIHNPQNGGFGQGNNVGVEVANGELLFFLNPDTILIEYIFSYLLKKFESRKLTAAGFKLLSKEGNINNSFAFFPEFNFVYFFLPIKLINFLVIKLGMFSKFIFPWGADLIVRRKDFMEAGMFDEKMFLCNEEPDLMKRLKFCKVRIFNKSIIHLEGHTTALESSRFNEWFNSTHYYLNKYNLSFDKFLKIEIKLNNLKIKVRKLLGLNVEHLISYVNLIKDKLK